MKKVLKFGGTSVGSVDRIQHVAKIIKKESDAGNQIIAVVSAMSGKTNELIDQSKAISKNFTRRELDVLLTSGEQVSSALLCGALNEIGVKSFYVCICLFFRIQRYTILVEIAGRRPPSLAPKARRRLLFCTISYIFTYFL